MVTKNVQISTRIVISYAIKWDIPLWIWWKVNGNWNTTWSEVPNGEKVIVEQILVSEEKTQKYRTMIITVWDLFLFYFCNYFCLKKLSLRCCIGLELNILTWSTKVLKGIGGKPYNLEKIWKIHPPRCAKTTFPEVFHPLRFLHLISNGLNRVNINSLTQIVALL